MASGTTRLALARMQLEGKQNGQHEYMQEITLEKSRNLKKDGTLGKGNKIPLKNPSVHNHSK